LPGIYREVLFKKGNISYEDVLDAYGRGIFPMGNEDESVSWYFTNPRTIIPVNEKSSEVLKISRSLKQVINKKIFEIKVDREFELIIKLCACREYTWINDKIIKLYIDLHEHGYAHSIEAYTEGKLAGGLYGVSLNGAFFGESMFHLYPNSSKIAVVSLYEILKKNNYILFDIQMMTPIFKSFGAVNITPVEYQKRLEKAMSVKREFKF
jgi:leucyl/phenylalanyl-tRNA---protein transferase